MGLKPQDVNGVDLAFGGDMNKLLPKWDEIPDEFKRYGNKWVKVVSDWFYCGLVKAEWKPKPGIDEKNALRHVKACMGSWEPKHEHKEAGCAYLLSEFFEDVAYTRGKLPV